MFVCWCVCFLGPAILCHGIHQRRRPDVSHPAYGQIQGATGSVRIITEHDIGIEQILWHPKMNFVQTLICVYCCFCFKGIVNILFSVFTGFTQQRLQLACFSCTERESSTGGSVTVVVRTSNTVHHCRAVQRGKSLSSVPMRKGTTNVSRRKKITSPFAGT